MSVSASGRAVMAQACQYNIVLLKLYQICFCLDEFYRYRIAIAALIVSCRFGITPLYSIIYLSGRVELYYLCFVFVRLSICACQVEYLYYLSVSG